MVVTIEIAPPGLDGRAHLLPGPIRAEILEDHKPAVDRQYTIPQPPNLRACLTRLLPVHPELGLHRQTPAIRERDNASDAGILVAPRPLNSQRLTVFQEEDKGLTLECRRPVSDSGAGIGSLRGSSVGSRGRLDSGETSASIGPARGRWLRHLLLSQDASNISLIAISSNKLEGFGLRPVHLRIGHCNPVSGRPSLHRSCIEVWHVRVGTLRLAAGSLRVEAATTPL